MRKPDRPLPTPDEASLHHAALAHLARYAATEAGLARVLQRRVDRWARLADADADAVAAIVERCRRMIADLVARLAASGAVSDAAFAAARARSLSRAGRSRRAIGAHLAGRGVPSDLTTASLPQDPEHELAAALLHARRRRMGPWRRAAPEGKQALRELASLARAGFAQGVARQALGMEMAEAEALIIRFRAEL